MEPTDIELMLRVRDDDVAAFWELLRRYREPLRRFFTALLADRSQVDDFIQETLMRLWLNRRRYEPTGKFSAYLYQIGRHYWFNQRKKFLPELGNEALERVQRVQELDRFDPEAALLERDRHARVRHAIAALPEHCRTVFEMSHFEELKYVEIAHALAGVVSQRLVRQPCAQCLVEDEPDAVALQRVGLSTADGPFQQGAGCAACRQTGSSRRIPLSEVLELDDAVRRRIVENAPIETLWRETFGRTGGSLWEDAREKVRRHVTTVEEATRALFDYPNRPAAVEAP